MIYAYAKLTVSNPAALSEYREKAGAALARHGGKVEHATAETTALDGSPDLPDVAALLSFPDRAAAIAWINDETLTDVHALRRSAGASGSSGVPGIMIATTMAVGLGAIAVIAKAFSYAELGWPGGVDRVA